MSAKETGQSVKLMMLFSASAFIAIAVTLGATYTGIRGIYTENVTDIAKQQSVSISEALFLRERRLLTGGKVEGAQTLGLSADDFELVDKVMRGYLQPFDILKIKGLQSGKEIIYSTDHSLIGRIDSENSRLANALSGNVDAELEDKDQIVDLSDEKRIDVDVVETYVPIRSTEGRIIGCAEIYMDVTQYRQRLSDILRSSMAVIGAILAVVFGSLFIVMRRATSRLHRYEQRLGDAAATDVLTGTANRRCAPPRG